MLWKGWVQDPQACHNCNKVNCPSTNVSTGKGKPYGYHGRMELLIRSLVDELVCITKNPNEVSNLQGLQKKEWQKLWLQIIVPWRTRFDWWFQALFKKKNWTYESIQCFKFSRRKGLQPVSLMWTRVTWFLTSCLLSVIMGASEAMQPRKLSPSSRWNFLYQNVYIQLSFSMIVSIPYECIWALQARICCKCIFLDKIRGHACKNVWAFLILISGCAMCVCLYGHLIEKKLLELIRAWTPSKDLYIHENVK